MTLTFQYQKMPEETSQTVDTEEYFKTQLALRHLSCALLICFVMFISFMFLSCFICNPAREVDRTENDAEVYKLLLV